MAFHVYPFIYNNWARISLFLLWIAVNSFVFYNTYSMYCTHPKFFYTCKMLKESLCISRASASVLNVNCALLLLPMCRRLRSFVRAKCSKFLKSSHRRLIDHSKGSHIYIAYGICIFSALHILGHLVNNHRFFQNYSSTHKDLNLMPSKEDLHFHTIFLTLSGVSGIVMVLVLFAMVTTSLKFIRGKKYEVFWYTHHLHLLFFAAFLCHGFGGIVKYQYNMDEHPPGCEYTRIGNNSDSRLSCTGKPKFKPVGPETWKWMIGPLFLFLVEKVYSCIVRRRHVDVNKVILHEGGVVEIRMYQEGFDASPGQYIRFHCPKISSFEWHAFTLAKCPSEVNKEFWIQIKVVGKWTKVLSLLMPSLIFENKNAKRLATTCTVSLEDIREEAAPESVLRVNVEGPYGGPFQDIESFHTSLLICAGIGVTPFSAVLHSLRDKVVLNKPTGKLRRVYFIWICRYFEDFYWFLDTLYNIQLLLNNERTQFLKCMLFVTRSSKLREQDTSALSDQHVWMQNIIGYGRPAWQSIFAQIAEEHENQRLGVFYCGPNALSSELKKCSTTTNIKKNMFVFHKESFG